MADLPPAPSQPSLAQRGQMARALLRSTRKAMLATTRGEQPYVALVTPACRIDGSVVLFLSELSRHTAELRANPCCAMLCVEDAGPPTELANPQTLARLSLSCRAMQAGPEHRTRYLALHPYAALYADLADFSFWRLEIVQAQFVGGFARAWGLTAADLIAPAGAAVALEAAEPGILAHCNSDHAEAIALLGRRASGYADAWRLVAIDPDGCDLRAAAGAARIAWPAPVVDADGIRRALMDLIGDARDMSDEPSSAAGMAGHGPVSWPRSARLKRKRSD